MEVTESEYTHIQAVYIASDLDKDAFCKAWVSMNHSRVKQYKVREAERRRAANVRRWLFAIIDKYGPATTYTWKCENTTYGVLTKRERKAVEAAGMELESGICPKTMANMLWEIRKHLNLA